jgi:hypothetical protein
MKFKLYLFALLGVMIAAAIVVSCTETEEDPIVEPTLSINGTPITSAQGGTFTVAVTSNTDWTAKSSDETVATVAPASGNSNGNVTVTVSANASTATRTATLTIAAGSLSETVTVNQDAPAAGETTLSISPTTITVIAGGEAKDITVSSNSTWTATSSATWVTVTPGTGKITVTAAANTGEARTAEVTVTAGDKTAKATVNQGAVVVETTLSIAPTTIEVIAGGEAKDITVSSNATWTATSSATWAVVSAGTGSGTSTITVTVDGNTGAVRTAEITVTAGEKTEKAAVNQAAVEAIVSLSFVDAGDYIANTVPIEIGDLAGYADNKVLYYKIELTETGTLVVTDRVADATSEGPNIWFMLYNVEKKVGSWNAIENSDGILSKADLPAGTYYLIGLLNYWYGGNTLNNTNYDIEITSTGAGTAELQTTGILLPPPVFAVWADRNLASTGVFVSDPSDIGGNFASLGINQVRETPCPTGWRLPTRDEMFAAKHSIQIIKDSGSGALVTAVLTAVNNDVLTLPLGGGTIYLSDGQNGFDGIGFFGWWDYDWGHNVGTSYEGNQSGWNQAVRCVQQ